MLIPNAKHINTYTHFQQTENTSKFLLIQTDRSHVVPQAEINPTHFATSQTRFEPKRVTHPLEYVRIKQLKARDVVVIKMCEVAGTVVSF